MDPVTTSTSDITDDTGGMTTTAQSVVEDHNTPKDTSPEDKQKEKIKKRNADFRQRIDACKVYRRKLIANWTVSIDYRRGKPFVSQTDEDQVAVNLDWSLTKIKQSQLFSQIPQIRVDHPPQTLKLPWVKAYESQLNDVLRDSGVESAMDECLPDCINAAGIGVVMVSYEAMTEDVTIPKHDKASLPEGEEPEMDTAPRIVDQRYTIERVSPSDLLWNISYIGSNFDKAPWIGRSGRVTWADAKKRFGLKDSEKESVLGEQKTVLDKLTHDVDREKVSADDVVGFDEIFYYEHQYDEDSRSFSSIHHTVFVSGKNDPVIDETWKGQKFDENGVLIGSKKYPIRVLTLAYLTDEAIPPSDSAVGRPQVNEINKARTQMIRQRERSLPVRWADVNRVDPAILQNLMRGTWQQFIPVQGDGGRVIGEVARAQMPQENFMFDKIAKSDLNEAWSIGMSMDPMANKQDQTTSPVQTREARERAKVASFFCSIAEVLGGLMCLYEDPNQFGQGFDPSISTKLSFSVLADSTILVDANQRISRLTQFINNYAKSGWVNLEPVMKEIASLVGLDPNLVIQQPTPKPPVEPNISLRLTGLEDLLNPLTLAFMIHSGQAPSSDLIEQAKQLIQQAVVPPQPPQQPGQPGQQGSPQPALAGAPPPGTPVPSPAPHPVGEANPKMTVLPQVNSRSESGGKQ